MSIKPILFNTDMVRAILDGQKVVTRRLINDHWGNSCPHCNYVHNKFIYDNLAETVYCARCGYPFIDKGYKAPYPLGDILYVRETYCPDYFDNDIARIASFSINRNAYKADYHEERIGDIVPEPKWTPSLHMPKKAARIWLKVTSVQVERIHEITNAEILREGANEDAIKHYIAQMPEETEEWIRAAHVLEWSQIWDNTVNKDEHRWSENPWVWVIEFDRCEKPQE